MSTGIEKLLWSLYIYSKTVNIRVHIRMYKTVYVLQKCN